MINKIDSFFGKIFNNLHFWGGEILDKIMEYISYIAEAGILFLVIGFALALFKKTRKIGGCVLLSVAIGFLITNVILKPLVNRARPFSNIESDFYKWWLEAGAISESGNSFPSGHTTATTAFSVAIFLTTNKRHFWWILTLPLLMACSRMYLMVHYFTDCLGGLVVGSASAIISYFIIKWIYTSRLKLFVWARELDLFNPQSAEKSNKSYRKEASNIILSENAPSEEFVYKTQSEEAEDNITTENNEKPE